MNTSTSQAIEFHAGSATMRTLGVGFTLVALGFGALHLSSVPLQTDSEMGLWIFLFVFLVIGLGLLGGFRRVLVDAQSLTVSTQWGVYRPLSIKQYGLDGAEKVEIHREMRVGSHSSSSGRGRKTIVYPVRLIGVSRQDTISRRERMKKERFDAMASATKTIESEFGQQLFEATQRKAKDGFENVVISESRDPIRARRDAERLAKLLGLAVEDHVGETVSRREHNELDQSLRERLRQKRSAPTLAAADYSSKKLTITDHGGDKEYQFLCVPYGLSFSIFGGLIFFFFALDGFAFESPLPAINDFFSVAFGDYARLASVVIIVMLVLALLFVCFGKYVITVDRHTIEVDM